MCSGTAEFSISPRHSRCLPELHLRPRLVAFQPVTGRCVVRVHGCDDKSRQSNPVMKVKTSFSFHLSLSLFDLFFLYYPPIYSKFFKVNSFPQVLILNFSRECATYLSYLSLVPFYQNYANVQYTLCGLRVGLTCLVRCEVCIACWAVGLCAITSY